MTTPPPLTPEQSDDGHLWYSEDYARQEHMWAPPDPREMDFSYPAWKLPSWYDGRTGMVQIPGAPGVPGVMQYVWGGWLPWQAGADRYQAGTVFGVERSTVAAMQAELFPEDPAATELSEAALPQPVEPETTEATPPTTAPTLGKRKA